MDSLVEELARQAIIERARGFNSAPGWAERVAAEQPLDPNDIAAVSAVLAWIKAAGMEIVRGAEGWRPTHRHVKRGTAYQVLGEAKLQIERAAVLGDYAPLIVYQDANGQLWARPHVEFNDGRFEPLPPLLTEGEE